MPTPSLHPDRLTTRLVWRNRMDGWASHGPTALLQGGALVAIAALMLLALGPLRPGTAALQATHSLDVAERRLDRAVLLVDGGIRADWDQTALAQLRADGEGLEAAVVARLRALAG